MRGDASVAHPAATLEQITAALRTSSVTVVDAKNGLSFPRLDCLAAHQSLSASQIPSLPGTASLPLVGALAVAGVLVQLSMRRRRADAR